MTTTENLDTGISTPLSEPWHERTPLLQSAIDHQVAINFANSNRREPSGDANAKPFDDDDSAPFSWSKIKRRTAYYIPSTQWIPHYTMSQIKGDLISGITVGCILIPQSISYATSLAKLSPLAGLFSASIPGLVYAVFGSSRQLNVAPEAALSLLIGQSIPTLLQDADPSKAASYGIAITTITTFQTGLFSFFLGFFRLGFIDVVLSRALLRGFVTAIAVVISIEQLIPMFGLVELEHAISPPLETTFEKSSFLLENLDRIHAPTATVAFSTFAILVFMRFLKSGLRQRLGPRWTWIQSIPEIFLVVVISTVLSQEFHWDEDGVAVLGKISVGSSAFNFPLIPRNLRFFRATTQTAVLISLVGYLDSMVAAKQQSTRFGYSISSNRELVALGAANIGASFIPGTLPAYGSITRSKLNGDLGGTSQMSSVFCSLIVLIATFFLLPALSFLPKCVLSAIVLLVVISLFGELPHDARYYWKMRSYTDLSLMLLTFVLTIVWDIEVGVVVSFIISLLLIVRRSSKVRISILGRIPGTHKWKPINEDPEAQELPSGILVIRIRENLDFANTAQLKERLRRLELFGHAKHHPSERPRREQARTLGFQMSDVETIDASAVQIFYELVEQYRSRNVGIFMTALQKPVYDKFRLAGIVGLVGEKSIYNNLADAVSDVESRDVPMRVAP